MEIEGKFYLGYRYDPQEGKVTGERLLYEPDDLTTHAVVVGMTGSGKTGLCINLLEEAALAGIPALMIDPKGDITNTLLHFPGLAPQDFIPWIDPDQARREGKTLEQASAEAAAEWREGLAKDGIGPERLAALKNAAQYAVYTPGSDTGIPVSILASLKAPVIPWESNRELLREKISGTVTALLGLVGGTGIDPVRSREHILLCNLFEHAWSQGKDLDLGELILQTQNPPFARLGVFDVNTFFPEKDRFGLAMLLNNILAAPAFQAWIEGEPLDIAHLLYAQDGRPRHSVFYIAHLGDAERMFFVTLLFSALEAWMRSQPGTPSLRSIVYFDEIFGYLPPIGNPPSKQPILRMLKQARAFGVGLVLATQNPVDMDYKALSNAGTWLIGKLQTEQDKQRLLDGLEGAMSGRLDRQTYDRMISALGKRIFLLHNIHQSPPSPGGRDAGGAGEISPLLFRTRWAMNYLAGPLTRAQIPLLNQLASAGRDTPRPVEPPRPEQAIPAELQRASQLPLDKFQAIPLKPIAEPEPLGSASSPGSSEGSLTRPPLPAGIKEYFLPNNLTLTQAFRADGRSISREISGLGIVYRPAILAQGTVRFLNRKYNLDSQIQRTVLLEYPDWRGVVRWEDNLATPIDPQTLDDQPAPQARFSTLEAPFTESKVLSSMQKDFLDWIYRSSQAMVRANEGLKLYAGPDVSPAEFRTQCAGAARAGRDAEAQKAEAAYDRQLAVLQEKQAREERELDKDQTELSDRRLEELGTHAENVISLFNRRSRYRRLSTSLAKRRMTEQAKAEVNESRQAIRDYQEQIASLEEAKAQALAEINERWGRIAVDITEITLTPYKKDVLLDLFGVAWMPYHRVKIGEQVEELAGYGESQ